MLYTIRNIIENGSTCTIEFRDYKPITMDTEWVENNELKPGRCVWIDDNDEISKGIKVVCAAITKTENGKKYLFATQRGHGQFAGGWEFPGGKIEADEDPQDAIKREIEEEFSTSIKVVKYIDTAEHDYKNTSKHTYDKFHISMDSFLCEVLSGSLTLNEHSDAKWLSKEELYTVDWLPADLPLVRKIEAYL